jgi:hypothetical protein
MFGTVPNVLGGGGLGAALGLFAAGLAVVLVIAYLIALGAHHKHQKL